MTPRRWTAYAAITKGGPHSAFDRAGRLLGLELHKWRFFAARGGLRRSRNWKEDVELIRVEIRRMRPRR